MMRASRISILAEWLLSGRFRTRSWLNRDGVSWCIEAPRSGFFAVTSKALHFHGRFRAPPGREPAEVFVRRRGKSAFPGTIEPSADGDCLAFSVKFIGSSGLKFYRLYARWNDGSVSLLGYRLLWCRQRIDYPETALAQAQVTPAAAEIRLPAGVMPEVSIVIPVFNQADCTLRCLAAIARHTPNVDYEIVLVDDASTEPSIAALSAIANLRVIRNGTNAGFIATCNRGAAEARGRFLVFLNNDTEVQAGWLSALLRLYRARPDAGLIGAKLVLPDGSLQEAGGIVWNDGSVEHYGRNDLPNRVEYNYAREVDYCSGACLLIEREFFLSLGGFDSLYRPAYFEDTDLAFRVREAGRKAFYQPACVVVHHEGTTSGTDSSLGVKRHQVLNAAKFHARWRSVIAGSHQPPGQNRFVARDRSHGRRPCVLVIDHAIPQFDRDAGSRSVFHYLQLLVEEGANVKFISDRFERDPDYAPRLEEMGVETLCGCGFDRAAAREWIARHGRHLDYVILSRPLVAKRYLRTIRRHTRAKIIYLGHDIHFLRQEMEEAVTGHRAPWSRRRHHALETGLWRDVDVVYYFTPEECAVVTEAVPKATARTIPLYILPPERASVVDNQIHPARKHLLFVGGFAHAPNRDALEWFLGDILPRVRSAIPEVELDICGSFVPDELRHHASDRVRFHVNISDADLARFYERARVCVVPLRYGAGMKGKVIEALQRGTPLVTTRVGAQGFAQLKEFAAVVDSPGEFADAIVHRYLDPAAATAAAARGIAYVQKRFSREAALMALRQDIELAIKELSPSSAEPDPQSSSKSASFAPPLLQTSSGQTKIFP